MLPQGYLEMDRAELEALDVSTLREIYAKHAEIAEYTMGQAGLREYTDSLKARTDTRRPISGADWILALRVVTCGCARCNGSGTYYWGAIINGVPTHSAPCARCGGTGTMRFDDMRRGRAYDMYAIAKACHV